jgi:hypothetical protein
MQRREMAARPGLVTRVREKRELAGGDRGSVREGRGGDEIGRWKAKRKTHFREDANGIQARWADWAERQPAAEGCAGLVDWAGP